MGDLVFAAFAPICRLVPSYPWCNLFHSQLTRSDASGVLLSPSNDPTIAPVGINPICGIPLAGPTTGGLGNIGNVIACGVSLFAIMALIAMIGRRKAAVGRLELQFVFILYALSLILQILTTGSLLQQSSLALVILTSIHAGLVSAFFAALVFNAAVATQIVEDGTPSSIIPLIGLSFLFFAAATYISLDTALVISHSPVFGTVSNPLQLVNIPLFVFTNIWPGAAALIYLFLMVYIILGILRETRPLWYLLLATLFFVLAQLDVFLLSRIICEASGGKVDGSIIATVLETLSMVFLFVCWRSITEDNWDDGWTPPN